MRKSLRWTVAVLAMSAMAGVALADIELQSKNDIQGTWKLLYTKNSATAKQTIPREDTWVFRDGKLTILNIPREGTHYDQQPVDIEIDNGKLKIPFVGRSGFDTFALIEKDDKTMQLKGKFGEVYFFGKK